MHPCYKLHSSGRCYCENWYKTARGLTAHVAKVGACRFVRLDRFFAEVGGQAKRYRNAQNDTTKASHFDDAMAAFGGIKSCSSVSFVIPRDLEADTLGLSVEHQELARQVGNGGTFCWYVELYSAGNEVTIGSVAAQ